MFSSRLHLLDGDTCPNFSIFMLSGARPGQHETKRSGEYSNVITGAVYSAIDKGKPMPAPHRRANATRSKVRSVVEIVFAVQKHRMALFVRTIGIERAKMKIGMANLAYNFKRLVWHEGKSAPA